MTARPLTDLMDPGWAQALAAVTSNITAMGDFLRAEVGASRPYLPAGPDIFAAFQRPFADVRVLIVGQDPYPTPGHPMGLSFSVRPAVKPIPRSLSNIFRELHDDLGITRPANGDLRPWVDRGVMLLNRVLTVQAGDSGSHRGKGWEAVTAQAISALAGRGTPLAAVLWGRDAQTAQPLLAGVPVVASTHPSPMSADRGFFGSKPFSRVNDLLAGQGAEPVDWSLPT